MPLFNVEDTIRLALDSILMQIVDFNYEIITVDDCSTDKTLEILNEYSKKYPQIKIIKHKENQGNAIAFYNALCASRGDYFCVLDGDDYYTVKNKLQKQVDFLDSDKNEDFVAVVHKNLRVNKDGKILDQQKLFSEATHYTYKDFLQMKFYYHTSTYMYRNIFKNMVPNILTQDSFRGDNPRTFLHLYYTKGLIKVLDFVGSVYNYNQCGIWSKMTIQDQKKRNLKMLNALSTYVQSEIEREEIQKTIHYIKNAEIKPINDNSWKTPEYYLEILYKKVSTYAFSKRDFIFNGLYKSEFIDSFCETLGFITTVRNKLTPSTPLQPNENNILITISNLTTKGGGVYYEIKDIINIYSDKQIFLLLTEINDLNELDEEVKKQLNDIKNLTILCGQKNNDNKIDNLTKKIIKIRPSKIYHYLGHNNVYAATQVQSAFGKNICIFSFDHGFSLGLDNTSYNTYITKRIMDYEILSKHYKDKVIYIPCWQKDRTDSNNYIPFNNHNKLITATGAARYYKLSGDEYIENITELLKETKGKHYHYGPIDETELNKIKEIMNAKGIEENKFINITWSDNIGKSMLDNNIDIFIEPFPIVSYKLTLEMHATGIPTFTKRGNTRLAITDFIYENPLQWETKDEFITTLANITKEMLEKHSKLAREYYLNNHSYKSLEEYFLNERYFKLPKHLPFYDNKLIDIRNIENLIVPRRKLKNNFIQNIFSIQNENMHKVTTIAGLKIKVKRKKI